MESLEGLLVDYLKFVYLKMRAKKMSKTVSVTEAKKQLSTFVKWSKENSDYVVIEVRGRPQVALVPYENLLLIQKAMEDERRQEAIARLIALAEEVSSQNEDLSDDEVDEIAEEISRGAVDGLVDKGKVKFRA